MIRKSRNLILALTMIAMTMPAWAVGTVTQSLNTNGAQNWVLAINWTGDSVTGTVPSTLTQSVQIIQGYRVFAVEVAPGSPAPTNLYSVTLTTFLGVDVLGGGGASLSNTTAAGLQVPATAPPINGALTFNLSGNSVAGAKGNVLVYFAPIGQVTGLLAPTGPSLTGNNLFSGNATFSGTTTLSGPNIITGTDSGNQTITGNKTFNGALAGTPTTFQFNPAGVWTNTQANQPYGMPFNGCNPQTEFQANQGANNTTDTFFGCALVPLSSTVFTANAIAGYARTLTASVITNGGYFSARSGVTGSHVTGLNSLVNDGGFSSAGWGLDIGVNSSNAASTIGGVLVESGGLGTAAIPAIFVQKPVASGVFSHVIQQSGGGNIPATYFTNVDSNGPEALNVAMGSTGFLNWNLHNSGGTLGFQLGTATSPVNYWFLQGRNTAGVSTSYPLSLNPLGGNVGVNNNNPGQPLDVTGNIRSSTGVISGGAITPSVAGASDLGTTALPFGNLWLGTAATNNFKFAPAATAAARTITIPDPLGNDTLPFLAATQTFTNKTLSSPIITGTVPTYNGSNTAGQGLVPVSCVTSQRTETAADANLLTCAIPAAIGNYRVRFVLNVSAANAATLGWTLTYTDSNGNAITATNEALFTHGTGTPALTFTTSAASDYWGSTEIDVNNSGTSIVVKLTFSGTSFTGKASATVERII